MTIISIYKDISQRKAKICVIGLGCAGLPIAVALSKKTKLIAFDVNEDKVNMCRNGIDFANHVGSKALLKCSATFTSNETMLRKVAFHIIAVPAPLDDDSSVDLSYIIDATQVVGRNLTKDSIVVYESLVYPGVTEKLCVPLLERESGMRCGDGFTVGYSLIRTSPGDKPNRLETITKIIAGSDDETASEIASVYRLVIPNIHRVSSIKVAEAIGVVEYNQRYINIAYMNEMVMALRGMEIDTAEVFEGMSTSLNALEFRPQIVGSRCISLNPDRIMPDAPNLRYYSRLTDASCKVNDGMSKYIADNIVRKLMAANCNVRESRVVILGMNRNEDTPEVQGSQVGDIARRLREFGADVVLSDPEAELEYGMKLTGMSDTREAVCVVIAVDHNVFRSLSAEDLGQMYKLYKQKIIIDVRGVLNREQLSEAGFVYWNL